MGLCWSWNNKIGSIIVTEDRDTGKKDFTINLYQGNCLLIAVYEFFGKDPGHLDEPDEDRYALQFFFTDRGHMRRMLGLDKKYKATLGHNTFEENDWQVFHDLTLNASKLSAKDLRDIVSAFAEGFKSIDIHVIHEEDSTLQQTQ